MTQRHSYYVFFVSYRLEHNEYSQHRQDARRHFLQVCQTSR